MRVVQLGCPRCGHALQVTNLQFGTAIECPHCHGKMSVPSIGSENQTVGQSAPNAPPIVSSEKNFFECPLCEKTFGVASDRIGTTSPCPHCHKRIMIPRVETTTVDHPWEHSASEQHPEMTPNVGISSHTVDATQLSCDESIGPSVEPTVIVGEDPKRVTAKRDRTRLRKNAALALLGTVVLFVALNVLLSL